jgi:hypothetical protein
LAKQAHEITSVPVPVKVIAEVLAVAFTAAAAVVSVAIQRGVCWKAEKKVALAVPLLKVVVPVSVRAEGEEVE